MKFRLSDVLRTITLYLPISGSWHIRIVRKSGIAFLAEENGDVVNTGRLHLSMIADSVSHDEYAEVKLALEWSTVQLSITKYSSGCAMAMSSTEAELGRGVVTVVPHTVRTQSDQHPCHTYGTGASYRVPQFANISPNTRTTRYIN